LATVLLPELLEGVLLLPQLQDSALLGGKINLRLHLLERHGGNLANGNEKRYLIIGPMGTTDVRGG
jgi:hypothetical protein